MIVEGVHVTRLTGPRAQAERERRVLWSFVADHAHLLRYDAEDAGLHAARNVRHTHAFMSPVSRHQ